MKKLGIQMSEDYLSEYRKEIDSIDQEIIQLLAKRYDVVRNVAAIKAKNNIPIVIQSRIDEVLDHVENLAVTKNMPEDYARKIYKTIIDQACSLEENLIHTDTKNEKNKIVS